MSLIEVMIAIVLLMIVSLALMQTSLVGYQANLQNSLREEATRAADQQVGYLRSRAYTQTVTDSALVSGTTTTTITRSFRGFTVDYTLRTTIKDIDTVNGQQIKQIEVETKWPYRGKDYYHSVTSILGRS